MKIIPVSYVDQQRKCSHITFKDSKKMTREHRIIERKIAREEQLYQEYIKKDSPELALFFLARATAFKEIRDEVL